MSTLLIAGPSGNLEASKYHGRRGSHFRESPHQSYTEITVLPELAGHLWDDVALSLVSGLRPEGIRVTSGEVTTDSVPYRVTVLVEADGKTIREITQEVQVSLFAGLQNGAELRSRLKGPRSTLTVYAVEPIQEAVALSAISFPVMNLSDSLRS